MWTIQSISSSWRDQVSTSIYGHIFTVHIVMRYTVGPAFAESPQLVWEEEIFFKDHKTRQYWHWKDDLFKYRPLAATFTAWRRRYIEAYNAAVMSPSPRLSLKGAVELRDKAGRPVRITHLPGRPQPVTDEEKARFIRSFIQKNDCQLSVEIDDYPALAIRPVETFSPLTKSGRPKGPGQIAEEVNRLQTKKERLLLFKCGADGSFVTASQYLMVDEYLRTGWVREFARGYIRRNLPVDGFAIDLRPDLYRVEMPELMLGFGFARLSDRGEYY